MEVEDGLSGAGADVHDSAIAVFDGALAGDVGGGELAAADEVGILGLGFLQAGNVFFGNDENMRGALRVEIFEGEGVVVFVDFLGRDFAAHDATKQAIRHSFRF